MAKDIIIPAPVADMISKLNDKSAPEHIRFNYRTSLENIADFCKRNVDSFDKELELKQMKRRIKY